jgi:hypothetical protein
MACPCYPQSHPVAATTKSKPATHRTPRRFHAHETSRMHELECGLGFLQFFWSENRMCAQDRLAETIVIDERRRSAPSSSHSL